MIRRTIVLGMLVGLLVSGLIGNAVADNRTFWNGPGPRPWQCGDPDWPAFSKDKGLEQYLAGENAGFLSVEPVGPASRMIQLREARSILEERRRLSRRYEVRILGRTIRIWR